MAKRPGDCRICGAPEPVEGEMTHAWDCPSNGLPKRFDWDAPGRVTVPPLADTAFTPLPPLSTLDVEEKARLFALARQIAKAWTDRKL